MILAAQIWAIATNICLFLPVAALVTGRSWIIYPFETVWLVLLACISTLHHVCDPDTNLIWSCYGNRDTIAFTEFWIAYGASICMVTPYVQQTSARAAVCMRIILLPVTFGLLIVDPYDGVVTAAFLVAALTVIWRGLRPLQLPLWMDMRCGRRRCHSPLQLPSHETDLDTYALAKEMHSTPFFTRRQWIAAVFAVIGFVLYVLARYLYDAGTVNLEARLWLHGSWHIPVSIAMTLFLPIKHV